MDQQVEQQPMMGGLEEWPKGDLKTKGRC